MKTFHFISGLPRSGSTLLSSILNQNPKFTAGITDPLEMYCDSIIRDSEAGAGLSETVKPAKRRELILGLFETFYKNDNQVCFNTNRGWTGNTALLKTLFPDFKMIVCLRDVPWILDSFEVLNSKNPYTIKPLYNHQQLGNVYDRTHMLMGQNPNFAGYVAGPLVNTRASMFSLEKKHILYVEYNELTKRPVQTMKKIYQYLGEDYYEHNFNDVEVSYDEFDAGTKIEGLHTIRKQVSFIERQTILPDDLWRQYEQQTFWKYNFQNTIKELNWIGESSMRMDRQI